jgi:spermidine synthase
VKRVLLLLFFSGCSALVYQLAWFRELRLIFGASTSATAAVLAVFMGGLGVGGAVLGKRVDRTESGLALYARLEIGVACLAALTPLLVMAADRIYIAVGGSVALGGTGATLLRVALSVVVLGPCTFLMGGTLPAAARAVEHAGDPERRRAAALYGTNTLGAVCGALLANFVLLEVFGTRITLWSAALLNLLVGVTARSLSRTMPSASVVTDKELASASWSLPAVGERTKWFPPFAAALAGFAFMLMELVWYRMLGPLLGGSSYTFGLILAVALVGIGLGGAFYARTRAPSTLLAFATTCSLEALFIGIPYALGDRIAIGAAVLGPAARAGFSASVLVWAAICMLVVLPAAFVSGVQFPLVMGLYGRGQHDVGRDVGYAYLANTVGAIAGAIAGGFGLIPLLGATRCWRLVIVSLIVGALLSIALDARVRGARLVGSARGVGLAILAGTMLLPSGPSAVWRHSGIGAGRVEQVLHGTDRSAIETFVRQYHRVVKWEKDGVESSVALAADNGYAFVLNGKADGHTLKDAGTQVMSGMLPAMLHADVKRALVVGLGTGSTAGWLGKVPTIERVDVVELEPAILDVARDCALVNESVLDNPKVHITLADAREVLRATPQRYDIIFSEPSNPYRAGISSMYTTEYYAAAATRLEPGGVFVQWMQAYEVDGWTVATVLVTLRQVFPEVTVWETEPGDFLLAARREHEPVDIARLRSRLQSEPFQRAARAAWRTSSVEGVLSHFVATSKLSDTFIERKIGAVNTDDQNLLEFAFARSVGMQVAIENDVHDLSRRLGMDRPDVVGEVQWDRIVDERWLYQDSDGMALHPPASMHPDHAVGKLVEQYRRGQFSTAFTTWKRERRMPTSLREAGIVAELAARVGGAEDEPLLAGAPYPADHDVLLALWRARHADGDGAVASLASALQRARSEPWMTKELVRAMLLLAGEVAAKEPSRARMLYEALREPFAVENVRDARLRAAAEIADRSKDPRLCIEAYHALEPPLWNGPLLRGRARCYQEAGDPRAAEAEADFLDYMVREAPFGFTIPGAAPQAAMAPRSRVEPDASAEAGGADADAAR